MRKRKLNLSVRLFLWISAAMLAATGLVVAMVLTMGPGTLGGRARTKMDAASAGRLVALFDSGGEAAVREPWKEAKMANGEVFLFDREERELLGQEAPRGAVAMARFAIQRERVFGRPRWVSFPVTGASGRRYAVVAGLASGAVFRHPRWRAALLRGVLQVMAIALLSYWISRWLTAPLRSMGDAARRFASGDLTARTGWERTGGRADELTDLAGNFDEMAARIESLIIGQRRFLAEVSHELTAPLTRLGIAAELARRANPGFEPAMDPIEREAERLSRLAHHLVTLSQAEGLPAVEFRDEISLRELLEQIAGDAEIEAKTANRAVSLRCDGECRFTGNRDAIRSAIENIVRNAVQHTGEGTTVAIALELAAGGVAIRIRDRGPGVPSESLKRLSQPFFRVPRESGGRPEGIGLGLTIAQRAADSHGGRLEAVNFSGGGLEVSLPLPYRLS